MTRPWDWSALDLDADPVPGSVPDVRATAQEARGTADLIAHQSTALRSASARSGDGWQGQAAREFRLAAEPLADAIAKAERRYRDLARALDAYADGLDQLQPQVDAALERAEDAWLAHRRADLAASDAEAGSPEEQDHRDATERAERDLAAERALLRRLVGDGPVGADGEFGALNDALVAAVELAGDDELKDTWWDDVKQKIHESRVVLDGVRDFLKAMGPVLMVLAFVPVIGQVAAAAGIIATVASLLITTVQALAGDATAEEVRDELIATGLTVVGFGAARSANAALTGIRRSVIDSGSARAAHGLSGPAATRATARRRAELTIEAERIAGPGGVGVLDEIFTGGAAAMMLTRGLSIGGPRAKELLAPGVLNGLVNGVPGFVGTASDAVDLWHVAGRLRHHEYVSGLRRVHVGSL